MAKQKTDANGLDTAAESSKKLNSITLSKSKPKEKQYKLYDTGGMYLIVKPNGAKYFRLDYRFNGERKTLALGIYPETSLSQARDNRDEAKRQIKKGIDPLSLRQAVRDKKAEIKEQEVCIEQGKPIKGTFEAIAREWLQNKYAKEVETATLNKTTRQLEIHIFPELGKMPINDIKSSHILSAIKAAAAFDKVETAHRLRTRCNNIFNYAIVHNIVEYNPVIALSGALPAIQVTHRAAITKPVLVGQLMRDIYNYKGTFVVTMALRLSALLMVRPGELRQAEWKDFYFNEFEWRYFVTKTKTEHIVPLSTQAIKILNDIKQLTAGQRYVFPSARNDGRPMSDGAVRVALRTLGYDKEEMSAHGFRTSASTLLNEQGWSPDAIERQLAHAPRDQVRAAYNRAQYIEERRRMMQSWADYLDRLRDGAEIIPFSKEERL